MKKMIIGIIIGGMIFGTIGVIAATTISSKNVTYQDKTVNTALDELYNEATTGKELVAAAITNKGVSTTSTDTYQTMANNINSIDIDHTEIIGKINNLESKHNSDITTINNSINSINQNLVFKSVLLDVQFDEYWAEVTVDKLGVDDATKYVWQLIPNATWVYIPFVYGYAGKGLSLRCWQLNNTTNGSVSLLYSGKISILFKGVRVK